MRPRVIDCRGQSMPVTNLQRRLQGVVIAVGGRLKLIHVYQSGELDCSRCGVHLIDISITEKLATCRADVADFEGNILRQLLLPIQVVHLNVGSANSLVHSEYIGRRETPSRKHAHACLDGFCGRKTESDRVSTDTVV